MHIRMLGASPNCAGSRALCAIALLGASTTALTACAADDFVTDDEAVIASVTSPASMMWMSVGAMQEGRARHAAEKLTNDKVLVTGGVFEGEIVRSSTEIFDLGTYAFSSAGSMLEPRANHTMTMLDNGKVLVAGGWNYASDDEYRATAEIFDPATTSWSSIGSMGSARAYHTAVKLVDGRVLVAGGRDMTMSKASAELFDPATNTFSPTSPMLAARAQHCAVRLLNGKVMIIGGYGGGELASAELYDPVTSSFSLAATMHVARRDFQAMVLPDGMVLVVGGSTNSAVGFTTNTAEIYNPTTNVWSYISPMSQARARLSLTLLPNGNVLAAGGYMPSNFSGSVEVLGLSTGSSSMAPVNPWTWTSGPAMGTARYSHTATMIDNDKLLVTGGSGGPASAELLSLTGVFSM